MASLQVDAICMSAGGGRHEHITHVFGPAFGMTDLFDGVSDIFYNRNSCFTQGNRLGGQTPGGHVAANQAVPSQADYLRTHANGQRTDNLLALSRRRTQGRAADLVVGRDEKCGPKAPTLSLALSHCCCGSGRRDTLHIVSNVKELPIFSVQPPASPARRLNYSDAFR